MPTLHLCHTTTSLIVSHHHIRHNTTSLTTTHHHLCHKINSSNYHPSRILTPQTPKSAGQLPTTPTMALPLPSHTSAQIPWQHRPVQISCVLQSRHSLNREKRRHSHQIPYHLPRGCYSKLVLQAPIEMHLFLVAVEREVPA
jgi:hypothetical protein